MFGRREAENYLSYLNFAVEESFLGLKSGYAGPKRGPMGMVMIISDWR